MATKSKSKVEPAASARAAGVARTTGRVRAALSVVTGGKAAESSPTQGASALPPQPAKPKRTLTRTNIVRTVTNVINAVPTLVKGFTKPDVSPALREKVVLGVTSVNDCRYCKWGHTHWAMANGVPIEEVNQILGHQNAALKAKDAAEAAAILFGQHYAEHNDRLDPEAVDNLRQHFSPAQVDEIIAYVRAITLGNLLGNTVDAFLSRFRSHGQTSIFFEGAIAAFATPVLAVAMLAAKFDPAVKMDEMRVSRDYDGDRDAS